MNKPQTAIAGAILLGLVLAPWFITKIVLALLIVYGTINQIYRK